MGLEWLSAREWGWAGVSGWVGAQPWPEAQVRPYPWAGGAGVGWGVAVA